MTRIYGELLAALGVLERGQVVEASWADLAGVRGRPERGRMGLRAREVFERARGGVLFVSDAHLLTRGNAGCGQAGQAGQEAVDTLLGLMEDHRDEVVVVLAGGSREIGGFLAGNPGLASRFTRTVEFSSYSRTELAEIFVGMAEEADFLVSAETLEALSALMDAEGERFAEGNGREVRALFEASVTRQARRIEAAAVAGGTPEVAELQTLLPEDVQEGNRGGS